MHIQAFDSMDDAFAAMGKAEDAANARLLPGQITLRDAVTEVGYWAQAVPEWDMIIYGNTPPTAETQTGAGFDVDANRARGYLTGMAYSNVEMFGEAGDTHVSQVVPIDAQTFALASLLEFPSLSMIREIGQRGSEDLGREHRMLGARLAAFEQKMRV